MKTIIKTGYEKILQIFYENKKAEFHLRAIARKTKLNENSTTRFLRQLEKQSILKSKKDGNLKKYFIEKNSHTYLIFALFDVKRYNKLPILRKNALRWFFAELKEKPVIAVVFGSVAKENFTKESDLDLLLISNKKIKTDEAENNAESQTAVRINCIQIIYKNFLEEIRTKNDSVIQSAINTGYPITNHILYYEEILK